jgi:hypothetical protein
LPEYSTPNCASTASQASRPGKIRTPRNNPDLCAFLSARIERAICDGVLRIGALISVAPDKCLQTLEFNLIVSPNAQSRPLTSGRRGGLSEIRSGVLIRRLRVQRSSASSDELADAWPAAVGEDRGRTGLDNGGTLCRHNIGAKIEFGGRDRDDGNQQRGQEPNHHDLEVGASVCCIHRPVHGILKRHLYNVEWRREI